MHASHDIIGTLQVLRIYFGATAVQLHNINIGSHRLSLKTTVSGIEFMHLSLGNFFCGIVVLKAVDTIDNYSNIIISMKPYRGNE